MTANTNIREDALEEDILVDAPPFPRRAGKTQPIKLKLKIRGRGKPRFGNIHFEDWEAEQMKDPEFRAAAEELEAEYQAARERILMGKWIAWRDEQLREAFKQIGVEWHPLLLLPTVGYRRFVHEYSRAKEQVLELEAEVRALSTMLDCVLEDREKWEKVCREWLKGRTCSSPGCQEDCAECTKAFHAHLRKLATDEGYEELDSMILEHCICGKELDTLGICKALPYFLRRKEK